MIDKIPFKGHFIIQAIDQNNNIVDEWADDNMIMDSARTSMAEIFAKLSTNTFINKFKLGTLGHNDDNLVSPRGSIDGFTKERDRLFSEIDSTTYLVGDTVPVLRKNDLIYIEHSRPEDAGIYRYLGENSSNYVLNLVEIANTDMWEFLADNEPYTYTMNFRLPGSDSEEGAEATNFVEDDADAGSTIKVVQSGTSVTFIIDLEVEAGNKQNDDGTSIFTEAALYANNRIFSMKTFKAKIKDDTVVLRIIWTITF